MVQVQIRRGLFTGNESAVSGGFSRLWYEIRLTHQSEDNIQVDGSFHQHGPELLQGSYGSDFVEDLADEINTAVDTRFALPSSGMAIFDHMVLDGSAWMIRSGWDKSVIGRGVTRPGFVVECGLAVRNVGPS